ncbi:MAG: NYN domain-containing protein [Acidobacteriaceae bacterium]|nr:NYN domain-containing protein [Acidobacteriaceae bacterium]
MRTIVYVDGFNLYFRLLSKQPSLKWLNVRRLAERLLRPDNKIVGVKYYTARVSGRTDAYAPGRQQIYLDALATVPEISVHMGTFLSSEKFAGLVKPPEFRPRMTLPEPWPDVVKVIKVEEKGSDVNLASHLLLDAFQGNFDVAAVLSNDSDLVEPIRIVTQVLGKPVGLLSPVPNPTSNLGRISSFIRRISVSDLAASQFPNPVVRADGFEISKPERWSADLPVPLPSGARP